jgi:hypothetical protein
MSVHDDVRAAIEAFAAVSKGAMARGDLDAMLSMMTDDVLLLTASGSPVVSHSHRPCVGSPSRYPGAGPFWSALTCVPSIHTFELSERRETLPEWPLGYRSATGGG